MMSIATATELSDLRQQVELAGENVKSREHDLETAERSLHQTVNAYNEKRIEVVSAKLAAQGEVWCTCCSLVVSQGEAELLLVEAREPYTVWGNWPPRTYYSSGFSRKLHVACSECREQATGRHGKRGPLYDPEQIFYAFRVESRPDGYYALRGETWTKLNDKEYNRAQPSKELIKLLAEEFGPLPKLIISSSRPLRVRPQ